MKSRLEAFEQAKLEAEENARKQRLVEPEPGMLYKDYAIIIV